MLLKNSFKVFSSNFSTSYRLFVYKLIIGMLLIALSFATIVPFLTPVIEDIQTAGVFDLISQSFDDIKNMRFFSDDFAARSVEVMRILKEVIVLHSSNFVFIYTWLFVLILIGYILSSISDIVVADMIDSFCIQKTKMSFASCYATKMITSLKYTAFKFFLILPIDIFIFMSTFWIFASRPFGIISIFISFILMFTLIPLKNTLVCCFAPIIVHEQKGIFASFKKSYKYSTSRFSKLFSSNLFTFSICYVLNISIFIFTLGSLTMLTLAITGIYFSSFNMVVYYNIAGVKFYSDSETIVTPYNLKIKEDNYNIDLL